jgi:hypothetical protein
MNKILRTGCFIVAIVLVTTTAAFSQTTTTGFTYAFPRVTSPGLQLVISNINSVAASAQVTFYTEAGVTAKSIQLSLSPGTETIIDDSRASLGGFMGAAIVTSATPLLVNVTTNTPSTLDSASTSASSSAELVIPFTPTGSNGDTTISVFNSGTSTATVVLILGQANGTLLNGTQLVLNSKESRHLALSSLPLTFSQLSGVTHVIVRSLGSILSNTRAVAAEGDVTSFNAPSGNFAGDLAVVPAVPSDGLGATVRLPLFVQGFGYSTQLEVVNESDTAQTVTLTARGTNGAAITAGTNPLTISLPARGAFSRDVGGTFNLTSAAMGSISIAGTGPLTAIGALGASQAPGLAVIGPAGPAVSQAALQYRSITPDSSFSGLSFINSNSADATVSLTFITDDGFTISNAQTTVPAGNQLIDTLSDLMAEASGSGTLFLSSSVSVQIAAIEGANDGSVLSPLAVTPITTGFTPQTQQRYLAVGTATIAGEPIPGATVVLSGPASGVQTTDTVGAFVFRDIPPGTYTVSIQLAGITFKPSSTTFTITNQNVRNINFNGSIVGLMLTSVTPNSVLAGAGNLQITAKGGPFIPTSQIMFDGGALPTTFVDQNTLTGIIASASLRFTRVTSVQVQNKVGATITPSQALPFVVGNPAPVITKVSGVPPQIIAGYPGFTVTVTGTGFNSGGTVEFAGVSRPFIFDSTTQVHAFIGPADLAVGQIAALTVTNPPPSVGPSNPIMITVFNPVAGLLSISPSSTTIKIETNSTGLQLYANGFQFKPGATLQLAGYPALTTTYVSSTQLVAAIPPEALQTGGSFPVTVTNPAPNLGPSEVQPLIVQNLVPQLSGIDTGPLTFTTGVTADATVPVNFVAVLHGSNFGKEYGAVLIAPSDPFPSCAEADPIPLTPQVIESTEMTVVLPIKCTGTFHMYASSPQGEPGGGTSGLVTFSVASPTSGPVPTLSSLAPFSSPAGKAFTLTINGNNLQTGALVNFGTAILTPTSISTTAITVNVPAYYVPASGIVPVTVTNPGTGGTSTRLLFIVN